MLIPEAVWREVVETGAGRPGAEAVREAGWIQRCDVSDRDYVTLLRAELDEGEAEAIALARQEQATTVLLDEKEARRVAGRLKMRALGTIGVLIWARRKGKIADLGAALENLQDRGGFRIERALYLEALRQVGEGD